jgi:hypothetical protein
MSTTSELPTPFRRVLLVAGFVVIVLMSGWQLNRLFRGELEAPFDFAAFWVAGHLTVEGENPYQPHRVREIQRELGMDDTAIVVWNPPWALTLLMPFGALPFRLAFGAWVLVHIALMLAAALLLWRGLGGQSRHAWMACLLTLLFVPTIFLIGGGQITAVVLFGLAGFLVAAREDRPFLAGIMGGLTAVKPHLLTLFALWIALEATRSRFGRRAILGGLAAGCLACLFPTLMHMDVWSDYWNAVRSPSSADHRHLSEWKPPLLGWWLRMSVPGNPFWVQWIPLLVGVVGFIGWWLRVARRSPTDWAGQLTWIVGASMLIAPYGVWQHDLVLLLIPILAATTKVVANPMPAAIAVGGLLLIVVDAVSLVMMVNRTSSEWYVWVTPCCLLGSVVVIRLTVGKPNTLFVHPPQSLVGA